MRQHMVEKLWCSTCRGNQSCSLTAGESASRFWIDSDWEVALLVLGSFLQPIFYPDICSTANKRAPIALQETFMQQPKQQQQQQ
jgi:hypothetical protein